ncbi:MAG: rhamnogalacturonan lyase [Planctomycetes bacterium]|jgi:rhamnogalacturonan endolyase|nr:rhamnogalacturonan lyase [Planctomycetota bacterium]
MEWLGRGVVAVNQGQGKVFVSWRLLGTDPEGIAFNVYRATGNAQPVKLNSTPLAVSTCYQDTGVDPAKENAYFVRPVINGTEGESSSPFLNQVAAQAPVRDYIEIPLKLPDATQPGDGSVADLDGDGEYEIIIKGIQRPRDTASSGITGNTVLQAYRWDGRLLWTIQMGKNIREGEHDTQLMVYDLDGDGRAEIAVRTADGSVDGTGKLIGDAGADWVDRTPSSRTFGKIMTGPEYFSIFDGATGAELARANYIPGREPLGSWGGIGGNGGMETTTTGNRLNRFLACVAYLDGVRPSVIMCRGYYGRSVLAAWDWRDGRLTSRWVFDSLTHPNEGQPYVTTSATVDAAVGLNRITDNAGAWQGAQPGQWMIWDRDGVKERRQVVAVEGKVLTVDENMTPGVSKGAHVYGYSGMGAHSVMVADVDEDGKDEIVYGAMVVDDNGQGLFTTGLRHGDALHVAKVDPDRPALAVYGPHENEGSVWDRWTPGVALYEARTGKIIWSMGDGGDAERGITGDIDPRHRGEELWGSLSGVRTCRGLMITARGPSMTNFVVWWDGDLLREMVNGNRIAKWDWQKETMTDLLIAEGAQAAAGTKQSPVISADLCGDWREEVVLRCGSQALRIYTTTIATEHRLRTLMHDPQYRVQVAAQNVTYNQPPHPGFYLGEGMTMPAQPQIRPVKSRATP